MVADAYPNFSICGIPYHVSGEVPDWRNLAHRTRTDLEAAGLVLRLDTPARRIDPVRRTVDHHRAGRPHRDAPLRRSSSSAPARSRSARRSPASMSSAPPTASTCCTP